MSSENVTNMLKIIIVVLADDICFFLLLLQVSEDPAELIHKMTLHKGGIILILTLALHTSLSSQTNMTNPETLEGNYHPTQRGRGPPHPNPTVRTRASDRATTTITSDGTTLQVTITPSPRARTTRPRSTQRSMSSTESITRSTPRSQPYFTNNHYGKILPTSVH